MSALHQNKHEFLSSEEKWATGGKKKETKPIFFERMTGFTDTKVNITMKSISSCSVWLFHSLPLWKVFLIMFKRQRSQPAYWEHRVPPALVKVDWKNRIRIVLLNFKSIEKLEFTKWLKHVHHVRLQWVATYRICGYVALQYIKYVSILHKAYVQYSPTFCWSIKYNPEKIH